MKETGEVLVITTEPDAHLELVQQHLNSDLLVFDPHKFPDDNDISFHWDGSRFEITSQGKSFNQVRAVWYRKPRLLEPTDLPVEPIYQKYAHSAYRRTVEEIYGLLRDKVWISDYWSIIKSSHKLYQQEIAQSLGLRTPRTLLTSNPEDAQKFVRECGNAIAKMAGIEHPTYDGSSYVLYTSRVNSQSDIDYGGLSLSPTIFQEEIPRALDIRVTVVDTQVFACAIKQSVSSEGISDWRENIFDETLEYYPHELPDNISAACVSMVQLMGLRFGAIDFVVDNSGNYWFLEINPNGQWGFYRKQYWTSNF